MWVDYEPQPKNSFKIMINDADFYSLVKEEADFDPTKTEGLHVVLNINDQKDNNGEEVNAIDGSMPWIIDDVSDKFETALGMENLTSLFISSLDCKSWVANEFLDLMCSNDLPEQGLQKLTFDCFSRSCEPFEEEVSTRLAAMCPNLTHL